MKLRVLALTIFLTACQPWNGLPPATFSVPSTDFALMPASTGTSTAAPTQGHQAAPTRSPSSSPTVRPSITPTATSSPTPLPNPLDLSLYTQAPELVSAWRPALYPVPWALSEHDHFLFPRPIAADNVNWPLGYYRYGATNFAETLPHTGVDIEVPEGTPVFSTGPGVVVWTGYGLYYGGFTLLDPYGLAVAIRQDFGYQGQPLYTVYAHLSEILVEKGQRVKTGDIVALSGDTGKVTAAHLHYEVRLGENSYYATRNPELWIAPPQGWGVLVARITNSSAELVPLQQVRVTNLETGQRWYALTYGNDETINDDDYYHENFVLSDLPAGEYEIMIPYQGYERKIGLVIHPGAVTYFFFRGWGGFSTDLPVRGIPPNVPGYEPTPTPLWTSTP